MASIRRSSSRATSSVFAPLGDLSRTDMVVERLDSAIGAGLLADGERLPSEPELAARLGVATVTAREALNTLRERGLVVTVRGRGGGSFVRRQVDGTGVEDRLAAMTRVDLADRADLYEVITVGCAELAAERADRSEAAGLRALLATEPEDAALGSWRHTDVDFHLSVAALTQSARLSREAMHAEADFGPVLRLAYAEAGLRREARTGQLALVDAIESHDRDRARDLTRGHVRRAAAAVARIHHRLRSAP